MPLQLLAKHGVSSQDIYALKNTSKVEALVHDMASSAFLHIKEVKDIVKAIQHTVPKQAIAIFLPTVLFYK